jgi:tetratricopeptide (TPR) repeat protein
MLASRLGEKGWEARASGELGIISFLEGDSTSALTLVGAALKSARASGDVAAQIRYMALVGRALAQFGRHDTGLEYYKRAIRLAEETAGAGFPYIAVLGRGEALLAMNKIFEAKKVFEAALTQANRSQSIGYRVEALTHLGRLHAASGDGEAAKEYLEEAATTATQAQLDRLVAGAMLELAKLYRDGGDTKKAEEYAAMGIQARLNIEDVYLQPSDLAVQADLKRAEGKVQEADALYARATDIIDGMLVRVPTFQARGSLVAAKSDIYVKHFTLAIEQLGDPGKAFQIAAI